MSEEWLMLVDHQNGIFLEIGRRGPDGWRMENIRFMQDLIQKCLGDSPDARLEIISSRSRIAKCLWSHYRHFGFGHYEQYIHHPEDYSISSVETEEERHDDRAEAGKADYRSGEAGR